MDQLLIAQGIGKSFHLRPVLTDVTFSLAAGQITYLIGRNGCGKTTLLKILAGVMRPEAGIASLNGRAMFGLGGSWRREMVYLGHRPIMYQAFTARENIRLAVQLRGQTWDESQFRELARQYGLGGREDDRIGIYSEGMLKRLGLIRLEMSSWSLAYLDEPGSALDVDGSLILRETFDRWRSQGRSILFTSHDMGWGAAVADRAIMLSGGTVSEDLA
ncbi:MAG: ABC transporter ATP-binding protein, partial [Candidatus Marinimicrobia bacterium]|nr:ABC transporter ATP-binding protein [Candidatus Neomarinimicrobiota bacterium]